MSDTTPPAPARPGRQYATDDVRWRAVTEKDAQGDGEFWYAVKTTGVYCRPSCSSRRPNRPNVVFYAATKKAEHAGFRPCKRCDPNGKGFVVALDLPLDIRGTVFQQRVWKELQRIPTGETITYAELATRVGKPKAVRAVAQACGANTIAVAIPCHRVVRTDGDISGYRWGVACKKELLAREGAWS